MVHYTHLILPLVKAGQLYKSEMTKCASYQQKKIRNLLASECMRIGRLKVLSGNNECAM